MLFDSLMYGRVDARCPFSLKEKMEGERKKGKKRTTSSSMRSFLEKDDGKPQCAFVSIRTCMDCMYSRRHIKPSYACLHHHHYRLLLLEEALRPSVMTSNPYATPKLNHERLAAPTLFL